MNLYEINAEMAACVILDEETGELIGVDTERLNALELMRDTKIENLVLWIKNRVALAKALKEEKSAIDKRMKQVETSVENLKAYLKEALEGETFESQKGKVSYHTSYSTNVLDMEKLPEEYKRYKYTVEPDKTAIGKAIASGVQVAGAERVQNVSVIIK